MRDHRRYGVLLGLIIVLSWWSVAMPMDFNIQPRIRLTGDREAASLLIPNAKLLLFKLRNRMRLGNLEQLEDRRTLPDGSTIHVQSVFGIDEIRIEAPAIVPAVVKQKITPPQGLYYGYTLYNTNDVALREREFNTNVFLQEQRIATEVGVSLGGCSMAIYNNFLYVAFYDFGIVDYDEFGKLRLFAARVQKRTLDLQSVIWDRRFPAINNSLPDSPIAVDASGVYYAGAWSTYDFVNHPLEYYTGWELVKLDHDGNVQWDVRPAQPQAWGKVYWPTGLAAQDDYIYICDFEGTLAVHAKETGVQVALGNEYSPQLNEYTQSPTTSLLDLAADSSGFYLVSSGDGWLEVIPPFLNPSVVGQKFKIEKRELMTGAVLWVDVPFDGQASCVAVDATGVYVAGVEGKMSTPFSPYYPLRVRKYSLDGDLLWDQRDDSHSVETTGPYCAIDSTGFYLIISDDGSNNLKYPTDTTTLQKRNLDTGDLIWEVFDPGDINDIYRGDQYFGIVSSVAKR